MAGRRYRGQCVDETDRMAAEREKEERLQAGDEDHGGELDVVSEEIRTAEGAESVGRHRPTEKAVLEFCLSFAKTAPQLVKTIAPKETDPIIQPVFGAQLAAGELRRHPKRIDVCQRLLEDSRDESLAAKVSARGSVRTGSSPSVSGFDLYKKNFRRLDGDK